MKLVMFIIAPSHCTAYWGIDLAKKIESSVSLLGCYMHILRKPNIVKNWFLMNVKISLKNMFKVFHIDKSLCMYIQKRRTKKKFKRKKSDVNVCFENNITHRVHYSKRLHLIGEKKSRLKLRHNINVEKNAF
jgi:hypothetical protein